MHNEVTIGSADEAGIPDRFHVGIVRHWSGPATRLM
jgi:hypothetical protein